MVAEERANGASSSKYKVVGVVVAAEAAAVTNRASVYVKYYII